MRSFVKNSISVVLSFCVCLSALAAQAQSNSGDATTIRRISLLQGSSLELEIAASAPIKPQAQVIQGPNRLVLDFPGAMPAKGLHNLAINRGDVVDARVGLFSSNPPVTRVVLDLKSAQPYQLFSSGNAVVVKFGSNAAASRSASSQLVPNGINAATDADASSETIVSIERTPLANLLGKGLQPSSEAPSVVPPALPTPAVASRVEVVFQNGLLSIHSNKASLSEVLAEVHRRTGAEIAIPAGAESEQVFTSLGPGAPKEVLASLLNGSHFNFIVMGSERDPGGLRRVVLTPKEGGATQAVVYPCGSSQPSVAQAAPDPAPPVQAFGPPTTPEQTDGGDPQAQPPPPQQ